MTITVDQLKAEYGGTWGEHPEAPLCDWRLEVANNDTRLGYWEWVAALLSDDHDGCS